MDAAEGLWVASVRRDHLADMLEGDGPRPRPVESRELPHLRGDPFLAIWRSECGDAFCRLPNVLIGPGDALADLFAWSGSYLRSIGPISGIVRTITTEQFSEYTGKQPATDPWKYAGGAVGLIIGEMLTRSPRLGTTGAAAANPTSTMSFAIVRAWFLGFFSGMHEMPNIFSEIHKYFHQPVTGRALNSVYQVALTIVGDSQRDRSSRYSSWYNQLADGRNPLSVAADALRETGDLISYRDIPTLAELNTEERIQFFDHIAPTMLADGHPAAVMDRAFAVALTAYICRPGFEQQASLLSDYASRLPEAWLWLGAFQTFSSVKNVLAIEDGKGWRIARQLFGCEDFWSGPSVDIAMNEFKFLARNSPKSLGRVVARTKIEIELYPMIKTAVRGSGSLNSYSMPEEPMEMGAPVNGIQRERLRQLEKPLEEALRVMREILGAPSAASQRAPRKRRS